MDLLKESIKDFSDEDLIDQYLNHREEFTPEAFSIIENEINLRKIDTSKSEASAPKVKRGIINLDSEDFVQFEHTFSRSDLLMAVSILRENEILFFADNPSSNDFIPIETEASMQFSIHVHKDHIEKAHELLDEHFEKVGSEYLSRYCSAKDQLKSFNFHDIKIAEEEVNELIDVGFSDEEIEVITRYAKRLLKEVDTIEQQRVIFFYDCIEQLLELLEENSSKLIRSDLLTILEILQIYCDDPDFPSSMDEAIQTILSFFAE